MKKIQLLLLYLSVCLCSPVFAIAPAKVVLHINDGYKLSHLENSVKNIREELGKDVVIKVIINGKAVTRMLKTNEESVRIVQLILQQNVPIGLCHIAVSNNRVNRNLIIDGVDILETDGNVTIVKYLQQGYLYIKM